MMRLTSGQINSFYLIASDIWGKKMADLATMLNTGDKAVSLYSKQLKLASVLLNSIRGYIPDDELKGCQAAGYIIVNSPYTGYNELAPADFIIKKVYIISSTEIWVVYNRPFNAGFATNNLYYSIDNGVVINPVITQINSTTVSLSISPLLPNTTYTLTVFNVEDTNAVVLSPNPNVIPFDSIIDIGGVEYSTFGDAADIVEEIESLFDGVNYPYHAELCGDNLVKVTGLNFDLDNGINIISLNSLYTTIPLSGGDNSEKGLVCLSYEEVTAIIENICKLLTICINYNELPDTPFKECGCN